MSEPPPGAEPALDTPPLPGDADDTRARHLSAVAREPITVGVALLLAGAGFLAGTLSVSPLAGLAGAALGVAIAAIGAFARASSRAASDFFRAYAARRGLDWRDRKERIAPSTPLLRRGDDRYTALSLGGRLPAGIDGSIAHYTYVERRRDSRGRTRRQQFEFTICRTEVPESAPFLHELFVQRRAGFRFLDGAEDVFRRSRRVEQESEHVDRRFEIFIGADDDLNRARQLLAPGFLVWLADHTPEDFAFELVAGVLVANLRGHRSSAIELDQLAEATAAVAARLREEAAE